MGKMDVVNAGQNYGMDFSLAINGVVVARYLKEPIAIDIANRWNLVEENGGNIAMIKDLLLWIKGWFLSGNDYYKVDLIDAAAKVWGIDGMGKEK